MQRLSDSGGAGAAVPGAGAQRARGAVDPGRRAQQLADRARRQPGAHGERPRADRQARPAAPQGSATTGNIWVVYLKNADATKLATVLRAAFSAGAGGAGGGGGAHQRRGDADSTPLGADPPAPQDGGASPQATTPVTPSAGPSTGGFIQADPATNSLIITAPSRCTASCAP